MEPITEYIFNYDYEGQPCVIKIGVPDHFASDRGLNKEFIEGICKERLKSKGLDLSRVENWTPSQQHTIA